MCCAKLLHQAAARLAANEVCRVSECCTPHMSAARLGDLPLLSEWHSIARDGETHVADLEQRKAFRDRQRS